MQSLNFRDFSLGLLALGHFGAAGAAGWGHMRSLTFWLVGDDGSGLGGGSPCVDVAVAVMCVCSYGPGHLLSWCWVRGYHKELVN